MAVRKLFGEHNKDLCDLLNKDKVYPDWVITTAFYSAIHFVEDKTFPCTISSKICNDISEVKRAYGMEGRHQARLRMVYENLGTHIGARYQWLDDKSRYSRYQTYKCTPSEAAKANEYLAFIYKKCYPPKDNTTNTTTVT